MSWKTLLSLLLLVALMAWSGCTSEDDDPPPPVLAITTTSLPDGLVGSAYSQTMQASGGSAPYTWSIVSGTLPAGLSFNAFTGEISGTPTTPEIANFTARVTDDDATTDDQILSITCATLLPTIITTTLADGTTGGAYSETITAVGGTTPYAWSLFAGSLPAGLNLNTSLGQILGSPSATGTSNFTIRVTDANTATDDQALSITINPPPTITTTSLPNGIVGNAYSQPLVATGGTAPLVWVVVSGALPTGLSLSTGGTISGMPGASGTSNFTDRVADNYGAFDDQALSITIEDPLVITTTFLPDGKAGTAYSQTLASTGGVPTYSWSIIAGGLPAGLSLTGGSGLISGTPTGAGTSNFTVLCTDSGTQTDNQALSLKIDPNTFPRLLVANYNAPKGVKIWNNVDSTSADRVCDATLGGMGTDGAIGLALDSDRLFVASDSATTPLFLWDNAASVANGTSPTDALPVSAFAGTALSMVYDMFVDPQGDLYICNGYIRLFLNAGALSGSSSSQAQFTHQWGLQIYAMASETAGNKLIGGQVSGAGVICWNNPTGKTGEANPEDWTLQAGGTPSHMTIAGNRLYMTSYTALGVMDYVNIWDNISSLSSGAAPSVTMGTASTLAGAVHVQVKNDFMIVTINNPPTYQVNIYANASSITGETAPTFQITDATMVLPTKAYLADDGRLYVMDQDGILIFRGATTAPAFVCEITTDVSQPRDFLIME